MAVDINDYYEVSFNIISNVGMAKSLAMEALFAAKEGKFEQADEKLAESKRFFIEGQKTHATLMQKEAHEGGLEFSLILIHAEDQLSSTNTITIVVTEMIEMYRQLLKNSLDA